MKAQDNRREEAKELSELVSSLGHTPRSFERLAGMANGAIQRKTSGTRRGSKLERLLVRAAVRYFSERPDELKKFFSLGVGENT